VHRLFQKSIETRKRNVRRVVGLIYVATSTHLLPGIIVGFLSIELPTNMAAPTGGKGDDFVM
jgi:hypothetical protein